ncbi:hypothetical protein P781_12050 [Vibrio mimicus CAIM 1883]|nr:hypothetical protein P780_12025 [Vibrio mimicus CAIM 1882]ERM55039.1 hypothetical protein P781_12050 [Vibrio mimicus CAIM 1883]
MPEHHRHHSQATEKESALQQLLENQQKLLDRMERLEQHLQHSSSDTEKTVETKDKLK